MRTEGGAPAPGENGRLPEQAKTKATAKTGEGRLVTDNTKNGGFGFSVPVAPSSSQSNKPVSANSSPRQLPMNARTLIDSTIPKTG